MAPGSFDWPGVLRIARRYQLTLPVLLGAERCGLSVPETLRPKVARELTALFLTDARQWYLSEAIFRAFARRGIDYAPLKGLRLKALYPEPAARCMGDMDILVRPAQLPQAAEEMNALGFVLEKETHHELVFTQNKVRVELHKCLIPPYDGEYYQYYRDDWTFFRPTAEPCCYAMEAEDELVYLVTHFAKHYRDGGIGPKHLLDLWLFRRSAAPDPERVLRELKRMGLDAFYRNLVSTMEVWFDGQPQTELTAFLTKRLFSNGAWGTETTIALAEDLRLSGSGRFSRLRRVRWVLFPPADYLKYAYPVLQRHPAALPVVWVRRLGNRVLKKHRVRSAGKALWETTDASVSAYRRELEYVGLSFFPENAPASKESN